MSGMAGFYGKYMLNFLRNGAIKVNLIFSCQVHIICQEFQLPVVLVV